MQRQDSIGFAERVAAMIARYEAEGYIVVDGIVVGLRSDETDSWAAAQVSK